MHYRWTFVALKTSIMRKKSTQLLLSLFILAISPSSIAQITSSSVFGILLDSKKQPIIGATIVYTYTPTGLKYGAASDDKGYYSMSNMNPGGPYSIEAKYLGYQDINQKDIYLSLGTNSRYDFTMNESASEIKEVTVVTSKNKKTAGSEFTKDRIESMPTVSRNITDITKLTPQSNNNSFAGTNFRYNNVTLDGAINNDAIGFSPSLGGQSGTANMPGSSTRTASFSLDAIQEIQVGIAPYDVKLGNFTGGSINAVSRSGSNNVEGSVYVYGRGSFLTGANSHLDYNKVPSSFYDVQTGFRVGLPIIKNKLFFFTNEEITRRQDPQFYAAGDSNPSHTAALSQLSVAQAQRITDSLGSSTFMPVSQYNKGNYNPGTYADYTSHSYSYKFFNRLDYIISDKHQLSIRNNTVLSEATNLDRTAQEFQFGSYDFVQKNLNISTVAELKSRLNSHMTNSAIVGYTYIHDYRDPLGAQFPNVQINTPNGRILLGTNREAGIFNMKQNTIEITDNLTWYKRKHKLSFGTHNEIYKIDYGFINSWNGRVEYQNLDSFYKNAPSRIRAIYNPGDNSRSFNYDNPSASFWVMMLSLYAQDEIAISKRFNLSVGLRIDEVVVPKGPTADQYQSTFPNPTHLDSTGATSYKAANLTGISNNFTQIPTFSPRIGFNWDIAGNQRFILRGGTGIFVGRIPFAWYGYAYYNNGTTFNAVDLNPPKHPTNIPTDPISFDSLSKTTAKVERDAFSNNFHMPQVWRSSLAMDFKIPGDVKLSVEFLYTKTIYDVMIQQINLKDSAVQYASYDVNHVQPFYSQGNSNDSKYSSVYLISNTQQGWRYSLTFSAEKKFKNWVDLFAAYTYGQSKDILNGIRNSPESGWQLNQATNPNSPGLTFSNFDVRHKIVATVTLHHDWTKNFKTTIAFVYTGTSGTPFTWVNSSGAFQGKNGQQVELAYIPTNKGDISLKDTSDAAWNALNSYISNNAYLNSRRGQYTERNGDRTPWNHNLDMRIMQDFNFFSKGEKHHKHTLQVSFDIINLTNLLNPNWGLYYYTSNTQNSSVYTGLTKSSSGLVNGKPVYNYTAPSTAPFLVDQLASRWQGQLGLRYIF